LNRSDLPADVIAEVHSKLASRAEGTDPNLKYNKPLKKGDKVRIDTVELDNALKAAKKKPHVQE
jgi:hypothetical protein